MNFNLGMNNKNYNSYIVWDEIKYLHVSQQVDKHISTQFDTANIEISDGFISGQRSWK